MMISKMEAIKEIMRFQTDRGLHLNPFNSLNENTNIVEELFECMGYDVPKENRNELKSQFFDFANEFINSGNAIPMVNTDDDIADAYCDVIVFAVGALMKLGYDPEKALLEAGKEINSRVGEMVNGKFEKDLSPEAQANWYKADYSKAYIDHSDNDSIDLDRD